MVPKVQEAWRLKVGKLEVSQLGNRSEDRQFRGLFADASAGFCTSHTTADASRHRGTLLTLVLYSCLHVSSLSVVPTSVTR